MGADAMLHFEGDRDLALPPTTAWEKLSDARFLAQCIPGAESLAQAEHNHIACTLRPGFAFVRGTLELSLQVVEAVPHNLIRLLLNSKGIGSTSDVEVTLNVNPHGDGTRLHWIADIKTLGGLLKAIPQGLIQGAAQKVIADALSAVEAQLQR
jgi:carbon monoxide dehydrogenase subunit G